jgi:AraC-like DNA-binding protein
LKYERSPALPGIAVAFRRRSGRPGESSRLAHFRVSVLCEGAATVRVGTVSSHVAGSEVLLVPAGELVLVTSRATPRTVALALLVDLFAVDEQIRRALAPLGPGLIGGHAPRVRQLVLALEQAIATKQPALGQQALLFRVIEAVARATRPELPRPGRKILRNVRDYLSDQYAHDVSLDDLERVSGVSKFHLGRMFRDEFGVPPYAYLISERLYRAQRLLLADMSPSKVAAAVGFCDLSHLTRHFRRTLGLAPGAYRQFMRS